MVQKLNLDDCEKQEIKDALHEVRHPFELALYGSSNYFNTGSTIRTAHNFLALKTYAVDTGGYYKKATMAARKYEDVVKCSLDEFLEMSYNKNIVAFERRPDLTTQDIRWFQYPQSPILFFGSEKHGVPDEVLEAAHSIVSIPVFGLLHDHNVANAAAIACYDWMVKNG